MFTHIPVPALRREESTKTSKLSLAALGGAIAMVSVMGAAPAHADTSVPGWTEASFVEAAVSLGTTEENAREAWADPDLLPLVPVTIEEDGTVARAPEVLPSALAAYQPYSARRSVGFFNVFGAEVVGLTMIKNWQANGVSTVAGGVSVVPRANGALGAGIDGEVARNDFYSSTATNPNGGHTTSSTYSYSSLGVPGGYTLGLSITGTFDGTFASSSTGGN